MAFRRVLVTTEVTQLVPYNPRRTAIVVYNFGSARIFVSDNPANVLAEGFPLEPGASFSLVKADGDDPTPALYAQAETGTQDIRISESFV